MPTPLQPRKPSFGEKEAELMYVCTAILAVAATLLHASPITLLLTIHLLP